jgi:uncharacterized protein (DUF1778 family)
MGSTKVSPTSLRIPAASKRSIAAAAKRRGMSTPKFIIEAALREASRTRTAEEQLASELVSVTSRHLARIEAADDADDARAGDLEWERVKAGISSVRTAQEAKRALDL